MRMRNDSENNKKEEVPKRRYPNTKLMIPKSQSVPVLTQGPHRTRFTLSPYEDSKLLLRRAQIPVHILNSMCKHPQFSSCRYLLHEGTISYKRRIFIALVVKYHPSRGPMFRAPSQTRTKCVRARIRRPCIEPMNIDELP